MKHVLLIVACAVLLVGLTLAPRPLAMAEPPKGVARWEYATLADSFDSERSGAVYTLMTSERTISGSMNEVTKAMGGTPSTAQPYQSLLNTIGNDGWELVLTEPLRITGGDKTMYFKRPKL